MKAKRDALREDLDRSKEEANDLFRLLKRRAEENQTDELREDLLEKIETNLEALQDRFDAAEEQMDEINASIQKYDDIVGYLQVHRGLEGIEQMTGNIDQFIAAGAEFDEKIRAEIEAGMELVEGL
jgi:galactitol-specific phosphotransferase system IIB component